MQFVATWPATEVASSAATDIFKTVIFQLEYVSGLGGLGGTVRKCGWASEHIERSSGFNSGGGTEGDGEQRN